MIVLIGGVVPLGHVHGEPPREALLLCFGCGSDGAELFVHGIVSVGSLDGHRRPARYLATIPARAKGRLIKHYRHFLASTKTK